MLLIPGVVGRGGIGPATALVFAVMFAFAVFRSMGETASYQWIQEYVPDSVRGIMAAHSCLATLASCGALVIASYVIGHGEGLARFIHLMLAGVIIGLISVTLMIFVPGGAPRMYVESMRGHVKEMRQALCDRNFRHYLGFCGLTGVGTVLLLSFLPLYVKEQQGVPSASVVLLDGATMMGALASGVFWGWAADREGSQRVLKPAIVMCMLIPIGGSSCLETILNSPPARSFIS